MYLGVPARPCGPWRSRAGGDAVFAAAVADPRPLQPAVVFPTDPVCVNSAQESRIRTERWCSSMRHRRNDRCPTVSCTIWIELVLANSNVECGLTGRGVWGVLLARSRAARAATRSSIATSLGWSALVGGDGRRRRCSADIGHLLRSRVECRICTQIGQRLEFIHPKRKSEMI